MVTNYSLFLNILHHGPAFQKHPVICLLRWFSVITQDGSLKYNGWEKNTSVVLTICLGVIIKEECARFPPCLNKSHRRAPLQLQTASQHSWQQQESWPPLSLEPLPSSGWRKSRNTQRCWGGSGRHSHPRHRPKRRRNQRYLKEVGCIQYFLGVKGSSFDLLFYSSKEEKY